MDLCWTDPGLGLTLSSAACEGPVQRADGETHSDTAFTAPSHTVLLFWCWNISVSPPKPGCFGKKKTHDTQMLVPGDWFERAGQSWDGGLTPEHVTEMEYGRRDQPTIFGCGVQQLMWFDKTLIECIAYGVGGFGMQMVIWHMIWDGYAHAPYVTALSSLYGMHDECSRAWTLGLTAWLVAPRRTWVPRGSSPHWAQGANRRSLCYY